MYIIVQYITRVDVGKFRIALTWVKLRIRHTARNRWKTTGS